MIAVRLTHARRNCRLALAVAALSALTAPVAAAATFSSPTVIDSTQNASEPGIAVDGAGRVFVNAPAGLPGPSSIWRSGDGGGNWNAVGPAAVGISTAPNATIGGGDSDLAIDAANRLYFVDLWLGDASTAFSADAGASWTGIPFGTVPIQDRPWVSADPRAGHAGTAYSVTEQLGTGLFLSRTVANAAAGAVYPVSTLEISTAARGFVGTAPPGNLVTDANGTTSNVYAVLSANGHGGGVGLSRTPAGSLTSVNRIVKPADGAGDQTAAFPVVGVDNAADQNVYVVWTDPAGGGGNWNIRFASSTDGGVTWSAAVTLGQGVYPWITAGAAGKVDVAWYSAAPAYTGAPDSAPAGTKWNVAFSQSVNALGSVPLFSAPVTAASSVKTGPICTQGTSCTADRELGDFLSTAHDALGNALIAFATVPGAGRSEITFTKQIAGTTIN